MNIAREREGDAVVGRMLLQRGLQKLDNDQPYEAIRLLGRSQQLLAIRECRRELISAYAACSHAYEKASLLWAARSSMLFATTQALNLFHEEGTFTRQAQACLLRLPWIELQLGRVPCALAWIETAALLSQTISLDADEQEALRNQWMHLDFTIALLLLKTDFFDTKRLTHLAPTLDRLALHFSWIALLYVLGHESKLRDENVFPETENPQEVSATFAEAVRRVEVGDLPDAPIFLDRQKIELKSSVLGCAISVELPNQNRSMFLAEGILSAVEAFLSTSLHGNFLPYAANLRIKLIPSEFASKPLEWSIDQSRSLIEIRHLTGAVDDYTELPELFTQLVLQITSAIAVATDSNQLDSFVGEEKALVRSLSLIGVATSIGNILGSSPKLRLTDWETADGEIFPQLRSEPWNYGQSSPADADISRPAQSKKQGGLPLTFDTEQLKHRDFTVMSVINIPMWNKAKWRGAGFIGAMDPTIPPVMALLFEDKQAGAQIFAAWRHDIGPIDKTSKLRVTVIKGIDRDHPSHYRVVIGTNIDKQASKNSSHFVMTSRCCTMLPPTTENVDKFIEEVDRVGAFFLAPGFAESGSPVPLPTFVRELTIRCSQLNVRQAWEIGPNDEDASGIMEEDNVLIPAAIKNAPVIKRLKQIKNHKNDWTPSSPISRQAKVGRNVECPCGSGKKFKKCHGR
jgi:hypothetical protein